MEDSDRPLLSLAAALRDTQYGADDDWIEHVPFVFWLIDALQPRVIVDLGRDREGLRVPFCEGAQSLSLCQVHVGAGSGVEPDPAWVDRLVRTLPAALLNTITVHAGDVSSLVAAVGPGSVDLVHLDAADDALNAPLARALSPSAVVVSHEPLTESSGGRARFVFQFTHAGGLHIAASGSDPPGMVRRLASLTAEDSRTVRTLFESLGSALRIGVRLRTSQRAKAGLAKELSRLRTAHADLIRDNDRLVREVALQMQASQANADAARRHEQLLKQVYRSPSWRMTKPLRAPTVLRERRVVSLGGEHPEMANDQGRAEGGRRSEPAADPDPAEQDPLAAEIRASGLVDEAWYLARYPAVAESGCDPVQHQLGYFGPQGLGWGGLDGQDPNPWFDSRWYRSKYGDALAPGHAPLLDYLRADPDEDRDPSFWFDAGWFRDQEAVDASASRSAPTLVRFRELGWARQDCFPGRLLNRTRTCVVFLSGLPDHPGHRYRILDAAAALPPDRYEARVLALDEWPARQWIVANADLLWIWRAPMSERLNEIVAYARSFGCKVIVDVDDLIFDEFMTAEDVDGIRSQGVDPAAQAVNARLMLTTMRTSDLVVTPTQSLATEAASFGFRTGVLPNGHDVAFAEAAVRARGRRTRVRDAHVRLGYAAGSKTHQRDLAVVAGALAEVLAKYPQVILVLFRGSIDLAEFPALEERAASQVEWREPVPLEELPAEYVRFDVNIAPLEVGNRFCEAKSTLKFNEAALVGVPTIASPTQPFREAIRSGVDGFLAASHEEWTAALETLISDPSLRHEMGERARRAVMWSYGPEFRASRVRHIVESVLTEELPNPPTRWPAVPELLSPSQTLDRAPRRDHVRAEAGRVTVVLEGTLADAAECLRMVPVDRLGSLDLLLVESPGDELGVATTEWEGLRGRLARAVVTSLPDRVHIGDLAAMAADQVRTEWILWVPRRSILAKDAAKRLLQIADATRRPIVTPILLPERVLDGVDLLASGELRDLSLISTALASQATAVRGSELGIDTNLWQAFEAAVDTPPEPNSLPG